MPWGADGCAILCITLALLGWGMSSAVRILRGGFPDDFLVAG